MTGMTVYGNVPDAKAFIEFMGDEIAIAGFCGCKNKSQGRVLAMACIAKKNDPLTLSQTYHIIHGRLSMKSDAMLARFNAIGGRHEIIERSDEAAEVVLHHQGRSNRFRLTWDDVKNEPFVYNGKEDQVVALILAGKHDQLAKQLKPKYATPRARMQMLWARVVSDGVTATAPQVNAGTYTPEEIDDFHGDGAVGDGRGNPPAVVEGTEPVVESTPPADLPAEEAEFEPKQADLATGEQISRMTELFKELKVPADKQLEAFANRGADSIASLSPEDANGIIESLEARLQAKVDETAGESKADGEAVSEPLDGPCSEEQINTIKTLMRQVAQREGYADIATRVKAKLADHGMAKLADLSHMEARSFIHAMTGENAMTFFEMDLKGHSKNH